MQLELDWGDTGLPKSWKNYGVASSAMDMESRDEQVRKWNRMI